MSDGHYDYLVIGGGQAGIPLAQAIAAAGRTVALAERKQLGGSCVNFGCTPTKAAIASARLARQARRAADFGLRVPVVEVDFPAVLRRARAIATESRTGLERAFEESGAPTLLRGQARLDGRDGQFFRVRVGERLVTAAQVILNTGTRSLIPDIEGLASVPVIHAGNWLDHEELPEHLLVLGGGYIGLEMAQLYRRLGSRVTIVEGGEQVASREDEDVAAEIQKLLAAEGITILLKSRVKQIVSRPGGVVATIAVDSGTSEHSFSDILVATGRKPNTDDLGLETIGLSLDEQGIVQHDDRLASNVPGIWVAGDIRGGPMFTHTSWDDYRILESQLLGDRSRTSKRIVPYAVFTDPELGRVGMSEREARESGWPVKVARFEMNRNGRAREAGEEAGFIKLVVDKGTRRLLGAAVLADAGAELVHAYVDLMNADAPIDVIANAVHVHPTRMEAVQSAARAV